MEQRSFFIISKRVICVKFIGKWSIIHLTADSGSLSMGQQFKRKLPITLLPVSTRGWYIPGIEALLTPIL